MPSSQTVQLPASSKILTVAAHAAFVPIGIVTVLLGPMLPWLSAQWSLSYTQAGSLFTAQFAASTLGVALSGFLASRRGFRFAINCGLLIMAVAVAVLPHGSGLLGCVCVAAYGIGLGLAIPAANLLVAEVNPNRRSAALNLLNFSWSVGSVACPFLVAAAIRSNVVPLFLSTLAGFMLLVSAGIGATFSSAVEPSAASGNTSATTAKGNWGSGSFLILCALFFLYVGTENAVGGWVASYAKTLGDAPATLAVMTPSFFYSALMIGRWLAPFLLRSIDDIKVARAGILLACCGMAALIAGRTLPWVMLSASVTGLGLSAIYPITISLLSRIFGPAATRVASTMFVMANLGGASLPWLVGYFSTRSGNLASGLTVPLTAGVLTLLLYFAPGKSYASEPENPLRQS
jgi:FHS family glucose/mannose:H+ symporter-like MFS transporter